MSYKKQFERWGNNNGEDFKETGDPYDWLAQLRLLGNSLQQSREDKIGNGVNLDSVEK